MLPARRRKRRQAVQREVKNTRQALGLLDASTLGKILVKGPGCGPLPRHALHQHDVTLKPGRCRYGLMCSENGFLIDDGVVARIDEDTFLCHTTTGGADRIHAHMEEWLQTEWWDWKVYVPPTSPSNTPRSPWSARRRARCWKSSAAWTSRRGAALHGLGRWHAGRACRCGLPHLASRASFPTRSRCRRAGPGALGGADGGGRGVRCPCPTAPRRCMSCAPRRASS
jgi:sarcosine oxidase subunit alpha